MSYAVYQFFQNGGGTAIVIRVIKDAGQPGRHAHPPRARAAAGSSLRPPARVSWGTASRPRWTTRASPIPPNRSGTSRCRTRLPGSTERYLNISTDTTLSKSLAQQLQSSQLVQVKSGGDQLPDITPSAPLRPAGHRGRTATTALRSPIPSWIRSCRRAATLATVDIFNILCMRRRSGAGRGGEPATTVRGGAVRQSPGDAPGRSALGVGHGRRRRRKAWRIRPLNRAEGRQRRDVLPAPLRPPIR